MPSTGAFAVALVALASLSARLYPSVALRVKVFGISRIFSSFESIHGEDFTVFPDTFACEDIHYHEAKDLLFGVSEATVDSRLKWFPPYVIIFLLNEANSMLWHSALKPIHYSLAYQYRKF